LAAFAALATAQVVAQQSNTGSSDNLVTKRPAGTGAPTGDCAGKADSYTQTDATAGQNQWLCIAGSWAQQGGGGGSIPVGSILLIVSGSCPAGFAEETTLNGKTLFGTVAANADVGGIGGADSITPAGTVSQPTFTGNALAGHVHSFTGAALAGHGHTFTGSALGTHLHGVGTYAAAAPTFTGAALGTHLHGVGTLAASAPTFTGAASSVVVNHVHVQSVNSAATGGLSGYTADTSTNTSATSGYSTANPTGGAASYTPAGTNSAPTLSGSDAAITAGTPAGTNNAPALSGSSAAVGAGTPAGTLDSVSGGTPAGTLDSVGAGTPAGTVSQPTFAGNSFDNRSAFVKVIFCRKT